MPKGFNRPPTIDVHALPVFHTAAEIQRQIKVPREDSGIEGLYDRHIIRDQPVRDRRDVKTERAMVRAIRGWILLLLFWLCVLLPLGVWFAR
jgi:hypothetical protein